MRSREFIRAERVVGSSENEIVCRAIDHDATARRGLNIFRERISLHGNRFTSDIKL